MQTDFDIVIVGGGIVGASIAYFLGSGARVLLLEAEDQPGYHATGRSAALFAPSYGPHQVRLLTRASRRFFDQPPPGFAAVPLVHPRGSLFVGAADQVHAVQALHDRLTADGLGCQLLDSAAAMRLVPALRPSSVACAVLDPDSHDIDVDALLQGYLRAAKSQGVKVVLGARAAELTRSGEHWSVRTHNGLRCTTRVLVNAAGAWADEIASMAKVPALGIEPRRRSAFLFEPPDGMATANWPAVIAIDESWYFKPDAGLLLGSPANADPVAAHDVVAEEFDVALGIHHIEQATSIQIRRPRSTWAGLRSFVADGEPVCGFDPDAPGFFWAAALGGYGIQTSPDFGQLCAALIQGRDRPPELAVAGLDAHDLSPARLRSRA